MTYPLVSVVVPLYNYADFLPRALESILAQTERDWECIIVDDGSTDDGPCVAWEYAQCDERFRLICHESNRGLSAARNTGFAQARGRYVMLLDPDDEYLPHAMERLLGWMRSHSKTALCYGNFAWENGSPGTAEPYSWATLADHDYIPAQAVMLDRFALQYVGGNDETLAHAEDWDHWLRIAAATRGAVHFLGPEPLYILHTHERQKTRDEAAMRAHDAILRERAARYAAIPELPHIVHASYALHPHGAQEVLRQIILGLPEFRHTIYTPDLGTIPEQFCALCDVHLSLGIACSDPDVLHIHYPAEDVMRWMDQRPDMPIVVTRHGLDELPDQLREYVVPHVRVWPWDRRDGSVCVPNGVDLQAARRVMRVVAVGRDVPCKRLKLFAAIEAELEQREPGGYEFKVIGLEPCVHDEALARIERADLLLVTSDSETRPLALMEALALGLRCISSDVGGASTVQGLSGLLPVSAGASEWADSVQRVARVAPPEHDGRLMAMRYGWLYRAMLLGRCGA